MRNILENFSPGINFWDVNPQFTTVNPFRRLWKSDKSRGKGTSSNIMWAIALVYHPKSDMYYLSDAKERIAIDFLKIKEDKVDEFWEEHKELVDAFIDAALTQAEKSLRAWEIRMKKRDEFLSNQDYTFGYVDENNIEHKDNTKQLDDMLAKTAKIYEEFFKIKKELEEEAFSEESSKKVKSATAAGDL